MLHTNLHSYLLGLYLALWDLFQLSQPYKIWKKFFFTLDNFQLNGKLLNWAELTYIRKQHKIHEWNRVLMLARNIFKIKTNIFDWVQIQIDLVQYSRNFIGRPPYIFSNR